ncbi:MFS transporter [Desulfosarcina variabilis]|uniref:MFS transporter n=1 Tax=Desulfosarcina variabilis TaxID=2300 RepID=UPI003AFA8E18
MQENKTTTVSNENAILFAVCVAQFLTPFMMSSVGVALPAIGREFAATAVQIGLIETVYVLGTCLFLLPSGRFGDIYGRKKVFVTGFVVFTAATALAANTASINALILMRFLQGVGSALVSGAGLAIVTSVFPAHKRGRILGIVVACVYCGLSFGPTTSGLIISHFGWRWIFYVTVPVQLVALCITLIKLKGEWADARGEAFDWMGSVIYIVALFFLIYGAARLEADAWGKIHMLAGGAGIGVFLIVEYYCSSPVLDVSLLVSNKVFAFSNIATMINYAASFGVIFFFSLYLQVVKGLSPQHTGWILVCQPVVQAVLSPIAGRLADKISPAIIATAGMIITAIGLAVAASVDRFTGIPLIIGMLFLLGTGFAFFSSPNMTTVMGSVHPRHYGIASSFVSTMRTMGMLSSMTIITIIFSVNMGQQPVSAQSQELFLYCMHYAFLIFCGLSVAGILFSTVRMKKSETETIKPLTAASSQQHGR